MAEWAPVSKMYDALKAGSIDGTDTDPHDRAVIRAMRAKYKPNLSVDGNPEKTLFISGLDKQTDEDTLWTAFRQYGKIKKCRLVRDIVTGFSKGYGFVEYEERRDAVIARRRGYRLRIDEVEVFVDYECERVVSGWVPRRFGGGLGGNKKAGQLRFGGRERPFFKPIFIPGAIKQEKKDDEEEEEDQAYRGDRFDRNRAPYDRRGRGGRRDSRDSRRSRDDYDRFDRRDQPYRARSGSRERIRRQDRSRSKDRTDSRRDRRRGERSEGREEGQGHSGMNDGRDGRQRTSDSWGRSRERSPARDQSSQRGQYDTIQNVEGRSHGNTLNLVNVQQENRTIDIVNSDDEEGAIRCEESDVTRRAQIAAESGHLASGRDRQAGGSLEQPAGVDIVRKIKAEPVGRGYGDEFVGVEIKVEAGVTDTEKEDGECDDEPIVSFVENIVVKKEPV